MNIGILGAENSHALNFAKYLNLPGESGYPFPDVRVTHIYAFDRQQAERVAQAADIRNVMNDPIRLIEESDAVMIVFRDGKYHYRYAAESIRRRKPTWVDKPIAIDPQEALQLVEMAKQTGVPLSGGSCCKWTPDVVAIRNKVQSGEIVPLTAMINFPVMLNSEYSGIHFYASHLVEMATEIFGFAVQSVYAQQKKDGITAIFEYEDKNIVLSFLSSKKYACYIIEPDKTEMFKIDTDNLAELGVKDFMHAIRTGTPQNTPINLYRYTVLVNAIKDSMDTGKQVIPELKLLQNDCK